MKTPGTESSAAEGARRIAWARRSMPALWAIAERQTREGMFRGQRVGVANVLEPKTANMLLALKQAGAEVSVYAAAAETMPEVADALRERGVDVFNDMAGDRETDLAQARAFLEWNPQILVDDGAELIRLAHAEFPDLVRGMRGAAEVTTSGVRPLRQMESEGVLKLPVIAINDAPTKHLFDNVYGTGQSCVMALLDVTNLQLAGRVVVVLGYGYVGNGVAP
jgi:adenosylhomocysteinase